MRKFLLFSVLVLLGTSVISQEKYAEITFVKTEHNFGEMDEASSASVDFEFTNTGNTPLVLKEVKTGCGCAVPSWPKKPVKPGEKSKITVVFNSTGKVGRFSKTVTVLSNAKNDTVVLKVSGVSNEK